VMMEKVERNGGREVARAMIRRLKAVKSKVLTITSDNGTEFASHHYIARKLEADFYFARPYRPWQRALCEKTNGLIRDFFPKGTPLGKLTQRDVTRVMQTLNTRLTTRFWMAESPCKPLYSRASPAKDFSCNWITWRSQNDVPQGLSRRVGIATIPRSQEACG